MYDPSEFYLKRAVGLKDGNKEMSQKQKEDLQEYREVQNESKDRYQVDPENIIGWDMLSDSWVHENVPIIFGKKKRTKFTTSIEFQTHLLYFIASSMKGKVTTELNERVKKFQVKMFKSGVSYHDYQVDLCQGMPYFEILFFRHFFSVLVSELGKNHDIYVQKSFQMARLVEPVLAAWRQRSARKDFQEPMLKLSSNDVEQDEEEEERDVDIDDVPDFPPL